MTQQGAAAAVAAAACLTDEERAARGLVALARDDRLALAAQRHSDDMVARNFFGHTAPDPAPWGRIPDDRVHGARYDFDVLRENIAAGLPTPADVIRAWLQSPSHCQQLLDPEVTDVGIGVTIGPVVDTPGPAWVQELATESTDPPAGGSTAPAAGCPYPDLGRWSPPPASAPPPPAPAPGPAPARVSPGAAQRADVSAQHQAQLPPRARLRDVRVRWDAGVLEIRGQVLPLRAGRRVVIRVLRDGRRRRKVLRTESGGRFAAYLAMAESRRPGRVKITVSGVPGELRTRTLTRRLPRA